MPVSELAHGPEAESRFRQGYVATFGAVTGDDPLYEAISAGQRYPGMEHWLALFHDHLDTLFDYAPGAILSFDPMMDEAIAERLEQIRDHYEARVNGLEITAFGAAPYKPLPPDRLYMGEKEWRAAVAARFRLRLAAFGTDPAADIRQRDFNGRPGRTFATERNTEGVNVFDAVARHVKALQGEGKRVVLATWTAGAGERLASVLAEHGLTKPTRIADLGEGLVLPQSTPLLATLGLERGFEASDLAVIAEQDILGDRLVRPKKRSRKAADVITEATSLTAGDLVVHADHGIGRFVGLKTITALGAPYDCLEIDYDGGKFYLPVQNIELLSRYGSDETNAQLDRLGGIAWQTRKAKLRKRLREIAGELIKVAALRQLKTAPVLEAPEGAYAEFVARFPHQETEDQAASIDAVLGDLRRAARWIASCAVTSASARPRWGCGQRSSQRWRACRSRSSCRRHCSRASTTRPSSSGSRDCRSASAAHRDLWAPRNSPKSKRASRTAPSTSSSARTRCSASRSSSRVSAC